MKLFLRLAFAVALLGLYAAPASAQQTSVDLGNAGAFAVLAGATVTNTGATAVTGDLGVSPGTAVTGFPPGTVTGTVHAGDATAALAITDLTTAYNDAAGRNVDPVTVAGNLGGMTLTPGLYKSTSSLEISSDDLTLDAQGDPNAVFIFQMASTLTTTSGRAVILAGGAKASNVFWQVGSSATLGTTSAFVGTIMADQSIALATGATLNGRALARIGEVTLDGNTVGVPTPGNNCPVLAPIGDKTVTEGQLLTFTATATDADAGQTLTFSLINLIPAGAAIDPATGVFTWTPTSKQGPGASDVTIQVADNATTPCLDSEIIHVTVLDAGGENQCPVLAPIGDKTVTEGQLLTFTATATDADAGQTLTFSLINLIPDGAAIDPATGVFTWTPVQGPAASDVTIQVADNATTPCLDSEIIHVTVLDAGGENQCPVLDAIGDKTVTEGQLLTFTATATDADAGQTLTFSLINLIPAGAAIDANTGVFTWTPTSKQGPGASDVTIQVADNATTPCMDSEIIHVTVLDAGGGNQCPVIQPIAGQTVTEGETVSFTVVATDPDNTTLVYSLIGAPAGAQIHPLTGLFTWTPTDAQGGTHTITVQVRDTCEDPCSVTATVTIVVKELQPPNQCPVLTPIGDRTVEEEDLLTFTAMATDPDAGQTLTFSLDPGFPTGAAIDPSTGVFTFTPTHDQTGTHSITIRVTDNGDPACSDFETIVVTVEEGVNECPVLAPIGNKTVTEGENLTFTVTATDEENDEIIFSLDAGSPAGAVINANTGVFTWTPTSEQGPGTFDITIRATDLCDSPCSDTETIQVTVLDVGGANECPVLAAIGDKTVTEGDLLTFTAMATDAENDEIVFTLENLVPAGAAIDASTGVFTWTPSSSQGPGAYDVTIQATDLCTSPCSDSEIIHVTVLDAGGGVVAGNHQGRMKAVAAPNPINPSTVLRFGTTREGSVKIQVFDLSGRLVRTLYDGTMGAGANSVAWNGSRSDGGRVSSGVYYFRVLSVDGQDVVRVTVLK